MKWYPNYIPEILIALKEIFENNKQADKYIQFLLKKNKKWGSRDRKFVSKVLYDIVRWKKYYAFLAQSNLSTIEGKKKILTVWSLLHQVPIPNELFFSDISLQKIEERKKQPIPSDISFSLPTWLYKLGSEQLGEHKWQQELKALNREAELVIRVNTLKISRNRLIEIFKKENIDVYTLPDYPDALFLNKKYPLTQTKFYKKGYFEIQDASSQLISPFTGAKPGMTVIDACAGAGGKTLHLAAQMNNKGEILAYDINSKKIKELLIRIKRNGVKNITDVAIITPEIVKRNKNKADILLIDAPCSSIGTLRRKPGLKWQLSSQKIKQINAIQKDILTNYEIMLKPGGSLIYVTCSILPEENEKMIHNFLQKKKKYTFVSDKTIYPSSMQGDGFYMAKLLKKT